MMEGVGKGGMGEVYSVRLNAEKLLTAGLSRPDASARRRAIRKMDEERILERLERQGGMGFPILPCYAMKVSHAIYGTGAAAP